MMSEWQPVAKDHYVPLQAGSVDGTDTEPHDRAVWRAMNSHYSPPDVDTKPDHTLFVGRLPHSVEEEQLHQKFSMFGVVEKIQLIRDVVTGFSKGYCFVEYRRKRDAEHAIRESTGLQIKGSPVLVDWEAGHQVKGWIPRRLGGGWGGRKEAGQLRFGCRDRPWKKPIVIKPSRLLPKEQDKDTGRPRNQNDQGSEDRHKREDRRHQHKQGSEENYRREDSRHPDRQGSEENYRREDSRRPDRQGSEERYRREHSRHQDRQGTKERYRREHSRHLDNQKSEERYRKEDRQGTEERYRKEDRQGTGERYRKEDRQGTEERYRREDSRLQDRQGTEERYRREDRQGSEERNRREHSRHQGRQESGNRHKRLREDYRHKEDIRRYDEKWERHRDRTSDRTRRHSSSPN